MVANRRRERFVIVGTTGMYVAIYDTDKTTATWQCWYEVTCIDLRCMSYHWCVAILLHQKL